MKPAPRTATKFSNAETALMRDAYLLASEAFGAARELDDPSKYRLARIVLYIVLCEKRSGSLDANDYGGIAEEAVEIMLSTLQPGLTRSLFGSVPH